MSRIIYILITIAILTFPLILFFKPRPKHLGDIKTIEGIELTTLNGEKFKFSLYFTDKKILLVFWSITCSSCIEEIDFIIKLYEKYKDKLSIIGIHPPGFPMSRIKNFVSNYKKIIPYLLAIDNDMHLIKKYEASILPKIVLIDDKGKVLYEHIGYEEELEGEIENAISSKL